MYGLLFSKTLVPCRMVHQHDSEERLEKPMSYFTYVAALAFLSARLVPGNASVYRDASPEAMRRL